MDNKLLKRIMEGEFPSEDLPDHKAEITDKFFEKVDLSGIDFDKLLQSCLDDIGRIHMFKRFFQWLPFLDEDLDLYRKNARIASKLQEMARNAHEDKNLKESLRFYNLAVAYAPYPAPHALKNLGKAGNPPSILVSTLVERSTVLLQARGGEEALRDILFVLTLLEHSDAQSIVDLRKELSLKQANCEKFIEEKASFMTELAKDSLEEMEKRFKYKNLLLFKIKKPNPLLPSGESFVEIRLDPVKGRQLVVNRDIPAGTTVVVEEPYVKVLKNSLKWDMNHCHYCFIRIRGGGGVPCTGCVFEIYCSPSCREEASNHYHKYECPCLAYLHFTRTPRYMQLAFRIVCTIGPKELYRLFITKDPQYFQVGVKQKQKPGHDSNGSTSPCVLGSCPQTHVYSSVSYLPIHHLISHCQNIQTRNEVEYFTNVLQGLIYASVLEILCPSFYSEISYLVTHPQEYFKTFVASIILHHVENIPCNSISIDELVGLEGISLLVKEPTTLQERIRSIQLPQYGAATYALSSLINHSCDPNVTRIHDITYGKMALVTLKGLKAGEELVTSYSKIFLSDTVEERRIYLEKTYRFACNCIACAQKWPILAKISETEPKFSCPTCSRKFPVKDRASPAFARCILDKKGHCRGCKKTTDLVEIRDQLDIRMESFFQAYELILKNRPFEAIRLLGPCMQFFQDHVCPPFNKIYMSQDLLKTALDLIVHYSVPRT